MFDEWLTIGLFDTCDETTEPVATFDLLHATDDLHEISEIVRLYNAWAADQPDVTLVAAAYPAKAVSHAD